MLPHRRVSNGCWQLFTWDYCSAYILGAVSFKVTFCVSTQGLPVTWSFCVTFVSVFVCLYHFFFSFLRKTWTPICSQIIRFAQNVHQGLFVWKSSEHAVAAWTYPRSTNCHYHHKNKDNYDDYRIKTIMMTIGLEDTKTTMMTRTRRYLQRFTSAFFQQGRPFS